MAKIKLEYIKKTNSHNIHILFILLYNYEKNEKLNFKYYIDNIYELKKKKKVSASSNEDLNTMFKSYGKESANIKNCLSLSTRTFFEKYFKEDCLNQIELFNNFFGEDISETEALLLFDMIMQNTENNKKRLYNLAVPLLDEIIEVIMRLPILKVNLEDILNENNGDNIANKLVINSLVFDDELSREEKSKFYKDGSNKLYEKCRDNKLIKEKRKNEYLLCTYCGRNYTSLVNWGNSNARSDELDHIFPKRKYVLDCICLENIVPTCPNCNRNKGEHGEYEELNALWNAVNENKIPFTFRKIEPIIWEKNVLDITIKCDNSKLETFLRKILKIEDVYKLHQKKFVEVNERLDQLNSMYKYTKKYSNVNELYDDSSICTYFGKLNIPHRKQESLDFFTAEVIRIWFEKRKKYEEERDNNDK